MATRSAQPPLLRLSALIFSAAAFLGVLRFSGVYAEETAHKFISMLSAVGAFPALALTVLKPSAPNVKRWDLAAATLIALCSVGIVLVVVLELRAYLQFCALTATLIVAMSSLRLHQWTKAVAALVMLLGLLAFATKISAVSFLEPADLLHLALAAGWIALARPIKNPETSAR